MEDKRNISVVVPVYNEEESVVLFYNHLKQTLDNLNYSYEIIFIDDGSTDCTFEKIRQMQEENKLVKILRFRRNFGKSAALSAGFGEVSKDKEIIVTMDADLQDDPEEIPLLIAKMDEGFGLVSGWRFKRKDSFVKVFTSRIFNWVTSVMSNIKIHDFNCGLKVLKKEITQTIDLHGELHRFIPVIAFWQGYKVGEVKIKHYPRKHGKSKFGVDRFSSGFFDLLTTLFLTRYTNKPLHFFGLIGSVLFLIGFFMCSILGVWKYSFGLTLSQSRPLLFLILGIFLIIVGLQFFSLGLVCEMIVNIEYKRNSDNANKDKLK